MRISIVQLRVFVSRWVQTPVMYKDTVALHRADRCTTTPSHNGRQSYIPCRLVNSLVSSTSQPTFHTLHFFSGEFWSGGAVSWEENKAWSCVLAKGIQSLPSSALSRPYSLSKHISPWSQTNRFPNSWYVDFTPIYHYPCSNFNFSF